MSVEQTADKRARMFWKMARPCARQEQQSHLRARRVIDDHKIGNLPF
jgi:hypothetical protein